MPRRPRIKCAGIPQHLVQRGVHREPCFFAEEDYRCRLHWRFEAAADGRCAVQASVLMTNHAHLPVTPQTPDGLAKLMQSVGRRHVQHVSRFYKRSGTLWAGRFQSSLVQTEDDLTDVRLALMQGHERPFTQFAVSSTQRNSRIALNHLPFSHVWGTAQTADDYEGL